MNFLDLNIKDNDLLKTRVETLELSSILTNKLLLNGIRSIGGLVRCVDTDLIKKIDLSEEDIAILNERISLLIKKFPEVQNVELNKKDIFFLENQEKERKLIDTEEVVEDDSNILLKLSEEDYAVTFFANKFGFSKDDLIGPSRKEDIVKVRNIVVYVFRKYADLPFLSIGKILGGRDHSTMIHSYNTVEKKIKFLPELENDIKDLVNEIGDLKNLNKKTKIEEIIFSKKKKEFTFNNILDRDQQILDSYLQKKTLRDVSSIFNITCERVRQIIKKVVRQLIINEFLSKGLELNYEILDQEIQNRYNFIVSKPKKIKIKKQRKFLWSREYPSCKICGNTSIPHLKNGICEKCAGGFSGERREKIISSHNNKCDFCNILRTDAIKRDKRDFYIKKNEEVFCRKCFLEKTGKILGDSRKNKWKKFFA